MARGVASRDFQGSGGNVCRNNLRGRQFVRQRDGDAARSGAHVRNSEILLCGAASQPSDPTPQSFDRDFNHMLGFRPRNQDVGRDFEIQAPEFLMASQMLRRNAARTPRIKAKYRSRVALSSRCFRMRVEPRAVTLERMHQQELRSQSGGRHILAVELRDAVGESGPHVRASLALTPSEG